MSVNVQPHFLCQIQLEKAVFDRYMTVDLEKNCWNQVPKTFVAVIGSWLLFVRAYLGIFMNFILWDRPNGPFEDWPIFSKNSKK